MKNETPRSVAKDLRETFEAPQESKTDSAGSGFDRNASNDGGGKRVLQSDARCV